MSVSETAEHADFLTEFTRKAMEGRVPLDSSIELTHRCNLRCVHCYLGDQREIRRHRREEMSTAAVKQVIDELVAAGSLNLTLSGGDPMVRKDFVELYTYAVCQGLRVTVFCDGILINDAVIDTFRRYPPRGVEITVYGASAKTYERVTQVPGSHARFLAGLERLAASGVRFKLKTVLMGPNRHELAQMRALAESLGVGFHFDTAVFPCLPHADNAGRANADRTGSGPASIEVAPPALNDPIGLRLAPEDAAKAHCEDPREAAESLAFYQRTRDLPPDDHVYTCGAGQTTCHIDPYGNLQACTISTNVDYNVLDGGFANGWNGPVARLRELRANPDLPCRSCDKRGLCQGCPAMSFAEHGTAGERSEYVCRITHELHARLITPSSTENHA